MRWGIRQKRNQLLTTVISPNGSTTTIGITDTCDMNYKKTLEFLFQQLPVFHRDGKQAYKANLNNSKALDEYLGHPHTKYRTIHVAGTNGKGSVSHMIASVLQEAGFRTGLYTSPHLVDFRERIRVNGEMIKEDEVAAFISEHQHFIDAINPSFFELTTAMAFDHFARYSVDVAVIEVGLGGALDCTNIIKPIVSVITNISMDHTDILGKTLNEIAREKAGIIKHRIPVVIGQTQPDIQHIFEVKAEMLDAPLYYADQRLEVDSVETASDMGSQTFTISEYHKPYMNGVTLDLAGAYQKKNILCAIKALQLIRERLCFDAGMIPKGLAHVRKNTHLTGRWQVMAQKPLTIIDAAHNLDGIVQLSSQIAACKYDKLHIIFGMARDKAIDQIIRALPVNALYYFTKANLPRALEEKELAEQAINAGLKGIPYPDVNMALCAAQKNAGPGDMIVITGSIYVIGELNFLKKID